MRTVMVKELMIPIEAYATVPQDVSLYEAVLALEKAQLRLEPSRHRHQAILVLDENGDVLGKLTMKDILIALEPNYGNLDGMGVLSRSGYSPDLIKSMLEENALWLEPLQFVCERATRLKVSDFVASPEESEFIDENSSLGEAVHHLIMYPYGSLLVKSGGKIIGILRMSDVFATICDKIKTCRI